MRTLIQTRHPRWLSWVLFVALLYVLTVHPVHAATSPSVGGQTADFTLFDSLQADAQNRSNSWFTTILGLVRPTFMLLGTIEICWAAAVWAFEKDNLSSLSVEVIKKIMFIGFFYTLLQYAPQWIPTITDSFAQAGASAAATGPVTTDSIIATGLAVVKLIWVNVPTDFLGVIAALGKIVIAAIATIGIVIAYVILAAQYFTLKIESYLLFAAGAIFLGLGSSSWTKEYVSKYLNYAINVGVRLLVLILVLSLVATAVTQMGNGFTFDYVPLLTLLAASLVQAILGVKAPEMAGALLSGGIGLHAGSANGAIGAAAGAAVGGAKMAAGLALGGVGAVGGALVGMGNLGKAVAAGREVAQQQGKSGMAANLSGLGMAGGQIAKELPQSLANLGKGGGGGNTFGQNPGPIDRAKQNLRSLADAGERAGAQTAASGTDSQVAVSQSGLPSGDTGPSISGPATSGQGIPGAPLNSGVATQSSTLGPRGLTASPVQAGGPGFNKWVSSAPRLVSSAPDPSLRRATASGPAAPRPSPLTRNL